MTDPMTTPMARAVEAGCGAVVCPRCFEAQEYRPVPRYEDRYWVSQCGLALGLRSRGPKGSGDGFREVPLNLAVAFDTKGYPMIRLWGGSGKTSHPMGKLHRLVLTVFVGSAPSVDHVAAHNDGDVKNSCLPNIRWATRSENSQDSIRHGTMARWGKKHSTVLTPSKVREIRELLSGGMPQRAIASKFGVTQPVVWQIKTGRSWRGVGDVAVR